MAGGPLDAMRPRSFQPTRIALELLAVAAGAVLAFRARLEFGVDCTAFPTGERVCNDVHGPGGVLLAVLGTALLAAGLTSFAWHLRRARPSAGSERPARR